MTMVAQFQIAVKGTQWYTDAMNKKRAIIVVVVLLLIGIAAVAGYFYVAAQESQKTVAQKEVPTPTVVAPSTTLQEYTDPSGFTFEYPDNLTVTAQEIKDTTTYAHVLLTAPKVEGEIAIKVQETKLKSLDAWEVANKELISSASAKEVKLGSLDAREVTLSDKTLIVAVDQNILFTIEVMPKTEKKYWENVAPTILASFSFGMTEAGSDSTSAPLADSADDSVVSEGEEVIE